MDLCKASIERSQCDKSEMEFILFFQYQVYSPFLVRLFLNLNLGCFLKVSDVKMYELYCTVSSLHADRDQTSEQRTVNPVSQTNPHSGPLPGCLRG